MADQPRELAQRGLRVALVAITALELVGAGVALWLVRRGAGPLLSTSLQRTLAYAWVALTIAAALAAYALAQGAAGATRERRARAALAGAPQRLRFVADANHAAVPRGVLVHLRIDVGIAELLPQ